MWKIVTLAAAALTLGTGLAVSRQDRTSAARHQVSGIVLTAPERGRVRIRHDDIPGYMPGMTMEFELRKADAALSPGDRVQFSLRVGSERSWIEDVAVTGHGDIPTADRSAGTGDVRLREGDALPPLALVDQDGTPLTADDFTGRLTFLTFIFTRCPVPDYCPLVSRRFTQVQSALAADPSLPRDVRLLSITIDPEFDTPPVLKAFALAIGADPARWRFAGGDPGAVRSVARAFSVYVERNGALLDHTLATALVDRHGRVVTIWRGNAWKVEELVGAVRRVGAPGAADDR